MSDLPTHRMSEDGLIEDWDLDERQFYKRSKPRAGWCTSLITVMSFVIMILLSIIIYRQSITPLCRPSADCPVQRSSCESLPKLQTFCLTDIVDPAIDRLHRNQVHFISKYSAGDTQGMDEVDANWKKIQETHGTVAIDRSFAASLGLPIGDSLHADPSKSVYVLEAYHSVHCLVSPQPDPLATTYCEGADLRD